MSVVQPDQHFQIHADQLCILYITGQKDAINWVHPNGFDLSTISNHTILASINEQVNKWNAEIQQLNKNPLIDLLSKDEFHEVDDPNNYIKSMITPDVLHQYDKNGAPPRRLQ